MLAIIKSCAVVGLEGQLIDVEVDVSRGLPSFEIVGLPNTAIKEAKERVRTAIKNTGFEFPLGRITVNMAPADIKKEGSGYDLPIAIGILVATGQLNSVGNWVFFSELSLDGRLRPVKGTLPRAIEMSRKGFNNLIVAPENSVEAALVEEISAYAFGTLEELVGAFETQQLNTPIVVDLSDMVKPKSDNQGLDFSDVKGQGAAKRAIEIAAAGGHNLLLIGPPGSGKTMLAKRLPTILPELTMDESFEVTQLYSVAGLLKQDQPLLTQRPFRDPHHTISSVGLVGGGVTPLPGEISLAHHGVLFLDEFPEFPKSAIEALREPLEEGRITISRVSGSYTYPAKLTLVAGMNPCYCGYYGDPDRECTCTPTMVTRYRNKLSGPILDRIDLQVEVPRISHFELETAKVGEGSSLIKKRVQQARAIQKARFQSAGINLNCQMGPREIKDYCKLNSKAALLLKQAYEKLNLSTRVYDRIKKVARTIADLEGCIKIEPVHIAEALQYRSFDNSK